MITLNSIIIIFLSFFILFSFYMIYRNKKVYKFRSRILEEDSKITIKKIKEGILDFPNGYHPRYEAMKL